MASESVYPVNFPDGQQAALNYIEGRPSRGTELAPGWIVDRIKPARAGAFSDDSLPIDFEVWVKRKPSHGIGQ